MKIGFSEKQVDCPFSILRCAPWPRAGKAYHLDLPGARWVKNAPQVILIDGCFLRCHGRILENLLRKEQLIQFDALSHYKRYSAIFDAEEVPEAERLAVARDVADWVAKVLADDCGKSCSLPGCGDKRSCCD